MQSFYNTMLIACQCVLIIMLAHVATGLATYITHGQTVVTKYMLIVYQVAKLACELRGSFTSEKSFQSPPPDITIHARVRFQLCSVWKRTVAVVLGKYLIAQVTSHNHK